MSSEEGLKHPGTVPRASMTSSMSTMTVHHDGIWTITRPTFGALVHGHRLVKRAKVPHDVLFDARTVYGGRKPQNPR
jgi:hypothetical protein